MPAIAAADRPGAQAEGGKPLSHLCADFVERVACDWRGVGAENGDPLKWGEENIRRLMNVPGAFAAILTAYHACRAGGRDLRLGN